MSLPTLDSDHKSPVLAAVGRRGLAPFLEGRFVLPWLLLIVGPALGIALALAVVNQTWYYSILVILAVPALVLIIRYPFAVILIWALFVPYFLSTPTSEQRSLYTLLYRILIPAALGLVILKRWLVPKAEARVRPVSAEWAMPAFLAWTVASILLWGSDPMRSGIQFYDRLMVPFAAYWLIRLIAPNEQDLKRLMAVAFVTIVVQGVIGLLAWFAPEVLPPQYLASSLGERTVGSLRNPAVYTSALVFFGLLLYHYAMNCTSRHRRAFLVATFGFALFGVFFSFSRGSWLGGLLVVGGLVWIYPRPTLRLILVLLLVGGLLGMSLLADEVQWGYERLAGEKAQRTAEGRVFSDNALTGMVRANPLTGWGYNNGSLYLRQFAVALEADAASPSTEMVSHNTYLTIAAELGILALILYLAPAGWWLLASRKVRGRLPQEGFWSCRLVAVLWLAMLHMFTASNFMDMVTYHPFGTTLWWVALGLIGSIVYPCLRPGAPGVPGRPPIRTTNGA